MLGLGKSELNKQLINGINLNFNLKEVKEGALKKELDMVVELIDKLGREVEHIPCGTDLTKDEIYKNISDLKLIEMYIKEQIEVQSKLNHIYTTQLSTLYRQQFDRL